LVGSDTAIALGIVAHGNAPVLALCRKLIAAGFDPDRPLHAFRGDMLALRVRSIGKAAGLTIDEHNGTRFAKWRPFLRSAVSPPMRLNRRGGA
jgi:hypothetical protein